MRKDNLKWAGRLLDLARAAETWGKGPDHNVGCSIASPDFRDVGFGYSGPPAGYNDDDWLALGKPERVALTVHAELNAIVNARRDLSCWMMAATKFPCLECGKAIAQARISTLVSVPPDDTSSWLGSQIKAYHLLRKMGVRVMILEASRSGYKTVPFIVCGATL